MKSARITFVALAAVTGLVLAGCSSSSKSDATGSGNTTTLAPGAAATTSGSSTSTQPETNVSVPASGCLLTNDEATTLLGTAVTGSSTDMPGGGKFCTYRGDSAGMSVSIKPYPSSAQAHALVAALLSPKVPIYPDTKKIDVGDGGGGIGCTQALCLARFNKGDVFVAITIRPGSMDKAESAATTAAAAL